MKNLAAPRIKKYFFGFSLIELLVVITLIGLLASSIYASWSSTRANSALLTSANIFVDNLQSAHIFSREAKDSVAWGIKRTSDNTYDLVSGTLSAPVTISSIALDPQVSFKPPAFEVWFDLGSGETDQNYSIQLVNSYNRKIKVDISKTGLIEMSGIFN